MIIMKEKEIDSNVGEVIQKLVDEGRIVEMNLTVKGPLSEASQSNILSIKNAEVTLRTVCGC